MQWHTSSKKRYLLWIESGRIISLFLRIRKAYLIIPTRVFLIPVSILVDWRKTHRMLSANCEGPCQNLTLSGEQFSSSGWALLGAKDHPEHSHVSQMRRRCSLVLFSPRER